MSAKKMRRAYLHIGVEKTGTTTIQAFLSKNRSVLRTNGYLYPTAPGERNHVGLTISTAENPAKLRDLMRFVGLKAEADLRAYARDMFARLADDAKASECHTMVLSNEHLSSRVKSGRALAVLRDALLSIADEIKVIVYLRRQDEIVLSKYSTRVKAGYAEYFKFGRHHLRNFDYRDLLDRWSVVFGSENIFPRLFEAQTFHGGDLVADFLHTIQCQHSTSMAEVRPQNQSLDVACLEYLRRINRYLPANVNKRINRARGNIAQQLSAISSGERPRISTEESDDILKHFEESNCEVARRFFGRLDGQLFTVLPERLVANNLGRIDEETVFQVSAALWSRKHETD